MPLLGAELAVACRGVPVGLAGLRDRALLSLGWFSACRASELVGLVVDDVELASDRPGLRVHLRRRKGDQRGEGSFVGAPAVADAAVDPVRAVEAWRRAAGIERGPLFRGVDRHGNVGSSLHADTVARLVRRSASRAELDLRGLSAHSLRAGFATEAYRQGAPLEQIRRHLGHKRIETTYRYVRKLDALGDRNPAWRVVELFAA